MLSIVFLIFKLVISSNNLSPERAESAENQTFGECTPELYGTHIPISKLRSNVRVLSKKHGVFLWGTRPRGLFPLQRHVLCARVADHGYIWVKYRNQGRLEECLRYFMDYEGRDDILWDPILNLCFLS
jgi:hypothetical protein